MYFFVQETVHLNWRIFTETFECLDIIKCYAVHSDRQIKFLQFMNICKCFNIKSHKIGFLAVGWVWKDCHFMGLACVNLYFYVSESVSTKFEPRITLKVSMSACDWTRKSESLGLRARKVVKLWGLSWRAEGNFVHLVGEMWIVLSQVGW